MRSPLPRSRSAVRAQAMAMPPAARKIPSLISVRLSPVPFPVEHGRLPLIGLVLCPSLGPPEEGAYERLHELG
jgi:hypothetical protein